MTKTNKELVQFINVASNVISRLQADDSKFSYALKKMIKKCGKLHENYLEEVQDVDIKHALEGSNSALLRDDKQNFQYTKEALLARIKEIRELGNKQVEVDFHYVETIPETVTEDEREVFEGFVIEPKADLG